MGQTLVSLESPEENTESPSSPPTPSYPVWVRVEVQDTHQHDFNVAPLACISVALNIAIRDESFLIEEEVRHKDRNAKVVERGSGGVLLQYRLESQERGMRVSGNTEGVTW